MKDTAGTLNDGVTKCSFEFAEHATVKLWLHKKRTNEFESCRFTALSLFVITFVQVAVASANPALLVSAGVTCHVLSDECQAYISLHKRRKNLAEIKENSGLNGKNVYATFLNEISKPVCPLNDNSLRSIFKEIVTAYSEGLWKRQLGHFSSQKSRELLTKLKAATVAQDVSTPLNASSPMHEAKQAIMEYLNDKGNHGKKMFKIIGDKVKDHYSEEKNNDSTSPGSRV